ncbi:RNA polymerase sigma factor (sigma-70 family) [Anaerosolibacter carboniphilus]|uniref:RNA polymerase sigma factor (Sigma-70 family) n=1 Tax=Anaerosolibacter carboniphilus TaxID=1417629 RepID=A0A841KXV9_9FIRM|nr:RNA polymerase sigma factor (sigma-70 family) [Anaerosolibacter carboniphilus]
MKNIPLTHENQDYLFYIMDSSSKMQQSTNQSQIKKLKKILQKAIEMELTEKQKQILLMYYYENKNQRQIAEELSMNQSNVSRNLRQAERKLKKINEYITDYAL